MRLLSHIIDSGPKGSGCRWLATIEGNLRVPHVTMLAQPLTNSAVPCKPVKKKGREQPKGSKNKLSA